MSARDLKQRVRALLAAAKAEGMEIAQIDIGADMSVRGRTAALAKEDDEAARIEARIKAMGAVHGESAH